MSLQDKCDTLDWALRRALELLEGVDHGESLVGLTEEIRGIHRYLNQSGLELRPSGDLVEIDV